MLHPAPNRPGFWAYRLMPDGRVLEIELTQNEWSSLSSKEMAAKNEVVRQLNEHPLNQAALVLLRRAGEGPHATGSLGWIHLLSLASLALPDWEEDQEACIRFSDWTRSVAAMRAALRTIEESWLEADDLLEMSPKGAGEYILVELEIE